MRRHRHRLRRPARRSPAGTSASHRVGCAFGFASRMNVSKNGPVAPSARNQCRRRRRHASGFVAALPERVDRRSTSRARRRRAASNVTSMPNDVSTSSGIVADIDRRRATAAPADTCAFERRLAFAQKRTVAVVRRRMSDSRAADTCRRSPAILPRNTTWRRRRPRLLGVRAVAASASHRIVRSTTIGMPASSDFNRRHRRRFESGDVVDADRHARHARERGGLRDRRAILASENVDRDRHGVVDADSRSGYRCRRTSRSRLPRGSRSARSAVSVTSLPVPPT